MTNSLLDSKLTSSLLLDSSASTRLQGNSFSRNAGQQFPFPFSLLQGFGITCQQRWVAAGRTHVAPLHKTCLPPGGKAAGNTSYILIILLQTQDLGARSAGGSISFDSSSSWHTQIQRSISEDEAPRSVTTTAREDFDICFYFGSKGKASPG